jgi:hypothetical protein
MSNATQHSQQSGDSRRRRSRGGKNRNNNQQDNRRGGERGERGERGPRDYKRGQNTGRSEEFRPQGPRPPRTYAPVKLSLWQKILKAIGLYKEPVRPARPERKPDVARPEGDARPPKSNTRNARTNEGTSAGRSAERPERTASDAPKRGNRGAERDRDRPRGGDGSTVESPRVYVGNLSYDVTEQDLQELFKGIGPVRNVEIVYNRSTHRSKGYGFVEMLHKDEAVRSVEVLHDQPFMGRKLTVSGAKSKGQDEREEAEDRPERAPRPVTLAPLPAAAPAVAETAVETVAVAETEPTIQTIVETVTEAPVEEAPVLAEAETETEPKSEIA